MSDLLASPLFLAGAIALVLAALAFLLVPMLLGGGDAARLRRRRKALDELRDELSEAEYRERVARIDEERKSTTSPGSGSTRGLAFMLLAAVPVVGAVLYLQIGTPEGIDPDTGRTGELREALGELTRQVRQQPDDTDAWNQLGMIYKQIQQFPAAESAFRRVVFLEPENNLARVELAETLLFLAGQGTPPMESERLLRDVLADDPNNQKALWLGGLNAFHTGKRDRALTLWRRLERQLPEGEVRERIREQIASAVGMPGMNIGESAPADAPAEAPPAMGASQSAPEAPSATQPSMPPPTETDAGTQVAVEVSLDPSLTNRITGSEVVFVFARAVNGPPAPLAVKRLQAAALPTTVVLSESDSMAEGLTLGTFPSVRVSARISRTGNVIASTGDLQGQTEGFDPKTAGHVSVLIDEIVE